MAYKVVKDFKDLKDNGHVYRTGDLFPRFGVNVGDERIAELSSKRNRLKTVLIVSDGVPEVKEEQADGVPEVKAQEIPEKKVRKKRNAGTDTEGDKKLLHS